MTGTTDTTVDLYNEFFSDDDLGNTTLEDIGDVYDYGNTDPETWTFVRAHAGTRDCLIASEEIYMVLRTQTNRSLYETLKRRVDDDKIVGGTIQASKEETLNAMPGTMKQNMVVPSPSGDYLTLKEIRATENTNPDSDEYGRVELEKSAGFTDTIPVEYVVETLSYDEVVCELIDK